MGTQLLAAVAAGLVLVPLPQRGAVAEELWLLEGTWDTESVRIDGTKFEGFGHESARQVLTFKGGRLDVVGRALDLDPAGSPQYDDNANLRWKWLPAERRQFRINPEAKPKEFDYIEVIKGKERRAKGIYTLDGDRLTICHPIPPGERPAKMEGGPDSGVLVIVYKRRKPPSFALALPRPETKDPK